MAEHTPPVVLAIRDVHAVEVIDSGNTLAVHLDGACERRIVVTIPARVGTKLVERLSGSLAQAARERHGRGPA